MGAVGIVLTHFSQRYPSIGGGALASPAAAKDGAATAEGSSGEGAEAISAQSSASTVEGQESYEDCDQPTSVYDHICVSRN